MRKTLVGLASGIFIFGIGLSGLVQARNTTDDLRMVSSQIVTLTGGLAALASGVVEAYNYRKSKYSYIPKRNY